VNCQMHFSMTRYKWMCQTHEMSGDEDGCLVGVREEMADLRKRLEEAKQALRRIATQSALDVDPPIVVNTRLINIAKAYLAGKEKP